MQSLGNTHCAATHGPIAISFTFHASIEADHHHYKGKYLRMFFGQAHNTIYEIAPFWAAQITENRDNIIRKHDFSIYIHSAPLELLTARKFKSLLAQHQTLT